MVNRLTTASPKILLLDNFDSFTHILADYFLQLGAHLTIVRNDATVESLIAQNFDAVILSPGPGIPADAGIMFDIIQHYHIKVPILGICLGHQAIGEFFGATLLRALKPMHGKLSEISILPDPIFAGIAVPWPVVRYHSLILKQLPPILAAIAFTQEGEIMAIKHSTLPIYGIQFHPEAALTQQGLQLLANWLRIYQLVTTKAED